MKPKEKKSKRGWGSRIIRVASMLWISHRGVLGCMSPLVATTTLLRVRYCLLIGSISAITLRSSETCITFGEAECWASECPASANLDRLRPEDTNLSSIVVATSTDIRFMDGSSWRPSLYGCCFSTAAVSAEGLEQPKRTGASWDLFLCLWPVPMLQVQVVCPRTLHCLQKQGKDSYITCWVKGEPLGRTRFTEVGRSIM